MNKVEAGSFTVEAAFVVPMVLGIVFVIWYVLFLFHDRAILQSKINEKVYFYGQSAVSFHEASDRKEMNKSLWITRVKTLQIKKKRTEVQGEVKAQRKLKIPILIWFMGQEQEIGVTASYMTVQPETMLPYQKKEGEY